MVAKMSHYPILNATDLGACIRRVRLAAVT